MIDRMKRNLCTRKKKKIITEEIITNLHKKIRWLRKVLALFFTYSTAGVFEDPYAMNAVKHSYEDRNYHAAVTRQQFMTPPIAPSCA